MRFIIEEDGKEMMVLTLNQTLRKNFLFSEDLVIEVGGYDQEINACCRARITAKPVEW